MNGKFDWLKRRRRYVRCKIHGLHYDPELTSGCVLCRKEGMLDPLRKGPQLIVLLLALLGMAVVAFRIFGPKAEESGVIVTPVVEEREVGETSEALPKLDPESYREPLEQLEAAVFRPPAAELESIGQDLANAFTFLSRSIRFQDPEHTQVIEALMTLGNAIEAETFSLEDLRRIRASWEGIRFVHFEQAPWFEVSLHSSAAVDRAEIAIYRNVASELLSLIDAARSQTPAGEETAMVPADAGDVAAIPTAYDWQVRLEELGQSLPQRPSPRADASMLVAIQRLDSALTGMRSLGDSPSSERLAEIERGAALALQTFDDFLVR